MAKNLVIVESPAKAKTISRFLGKEYVVRASMGHVRDLPKSKMGIDIEHDFEPQYLVSVDKKKVISELKGFLKEGSNLWIATDEDREGEAIGWHLLEALKVKSSEHAVKRIVFHEITEPAIKNALEHPRDIDGDLVNAQQARRVLDRLVGYELSPLLWKKVRYGLSAGRVQSVAVRLVVDREREIEAFRPEEYWSLEGTFETKKGETFSAAATKTTKSDKIHTGEEAESLYNKVRHGKFSVASVEEKEVSKYPAAPFTTSTLQQEASRKLGFSVKKTMIVAQQLYEGVDVGGEPTALITYMRTDSTNLSAIALAQAREVIASTFGNEFALSSPRYYKSKKGAQEAHEAIRPVNLALDPAQVKGDLAKDQYRLYELIWKRTIACQMKEASLKQVAADIACDEAEDLVFRATGQTVLFAGFMQAYIEGTDDEENGAPGEKFLPVLHEGDDVNLQDLQREQHFTKPPARYTEASLVKKLESEGIGRPSTYAPTISTIVAREYVEKDTKALKPTDLGMLVTDLLVEHFPSIVDYAFTAEMEEGLDKVAEGKQKWVPMVKSFYEPFHALIVEKGETLDKNAITTEATSEKCPECAHALEIKFGRFGKFYACTNYPECKYKRSLVIKEKSEAQKELEAKMAGKKCDKCGADMVVKESRYGSFLGCSGYPKCKNIVSLTAPTGVACPVCGEGQMAERRAKRTRKVFYGCNKYPKCTYAIWDKPTGEVCGTCGKLIVEKTGKDGVTKTVCSECKK